MELLETSGAALLKQLKAARQGVTLVSPFMTSAVAARIADATPSTVVSPRLLTALTERSIAAGVLAAGGLRLLAEAGWELRSIPNLHAKVALIDESWALVGSGNLTGGGLGLSAAPNVELGMATDGELLVEVRDLLASWWSTATHIGEEELEKAEATATLVDQEKGAGWAVGEPRNTDVLPPQTPGGWIKAMFGTHADRAGEWWKDIDFIHDRHRMSLDATPLRRPGYAEGDIVALYVKGRGDVVATFEVQKPAVFAPDLVASRWPGDEETYGWVTPVRLRTAIPSHQAGPTLGVLGVKAQGLQNGRIRLDKAGVDRVERALVQ